MFRDEMKRNRCIWVLVAVFPLITGFWGFFAHRKINYLAVFTLPPPMIDFYKANISYIVETSTDPDRRRYAVEDEARRHYIDIDHYGQHGLDSMPHHWADAVRKYSEDTLNAYGILPWNIQRTYQNLRDAFLVRDPERILRISSELGHYIGDANVPLHTTVNYNGQLTGQDGIHGFWESRLPELFSDQYDLLVGRSTYVDDPLEAAWTAVRTSHALVPKVLSAEKQLAETMGNRKYSFETRGKNTIKVYSQAYSEAYHKALNGMVEEQMRRSIRMIGNFWYSAWVDAGQPDLDSLVSYRPTPQVLEHRREQLEEWKKGNLHRRPHEQLE